MEKYIITSYIPNSDVNEKFLKCIKTFNKHNKSQLKVMVTKSNYTDENDIPQELDSHLVAGDVFEAYLNKNLLIYNMPVNVNLTNPLRGLQSEASAKGNLIVGSPTHCFKSVPRSLKHNKYPTGIWCTGSISKPYYKDTHGGIVMRNAHITGALYVEIESANLFNVFQITFDGEGFYHLDKYYTPTKVKSGINIAGLSLGDLHPPFTNKYVLDKTIALMKQLKPKSVAYHDIFDAAGISHHTEGKYLTKALISDELPTLEKEGEITAQVLAQLINALPDANHYIVKSNHDEHLIKYLDEFRFTKDSRNLILALDLCTQHVKFTRKLSKVDALRFLLSKYDSKTFNKNNVHFLQRDDKIAVAGNEISNHGDAGANGSKGSTKETGIAFTGKAITGHTHSPEITIYGNYVNGTMTNLSLAYTNDSGTSSWLNTHTIIYPNGTKTHYHIIQK